MTSGPGTEDVLAVACARAGLDPAGARLIRAHSNAVYLLAGPQVVVRISGNEHLGLRAHAAVAITGWLAGHGIPVTEPVHEPIDIGTSTVTFWRYHPQHGRGEPPMAALAVILRQLHALPPPPFTLPPWPPLAGFTATLHTPLYRRALPDTDLSWLAGHADDLLTRYQQAGTLLGAGLIHADAYPGNCLWADGDRVVLGDWDEVCFGARELDLIPTCHERRYGASEAEIAAFLDTYGLPAAEFHAWPGFAVLFGIRDLHTLTGYWRRAAGGDTRAATELRHRLDTLRDPTAPTGTWRSA
ncbi:aminoglycoside phosphotransferase family protein [Nocardia sp. alder85J]|uniref:phosphotransferase n=1 Tax=Nocardia sp. alder85J TaxID=2862949 RepID=UPI001CD53F39|nr:aminoglycoside phosphotransferase family protein [Nocardia sp. alder85J]MCX4097743.1 aminoglycoside phosphotransferase family protein [Nocardia sp. alder85J]